MYMDFSFSPDSGNQQINRVIKEMFSIEIVVYLEIIVEGVEEKPEELCKQLIRNHCN